MKTDKDNSPQEKWNRDAQKTGNRNSESQTFDSVHWRVSISRRGTLLSSLVKLYSREGHLSFNSTHIFLRSKVPGGDNSIDGPLYSSSTRPKFNSIAWSKQQSCTCKCFSGFEGWDICNLVSILQLAIPSNSKTLQLDIKSWRPSLVIVIFVSAK